MSKLLTLGLVAVGVLVSLVPFFALIGLGVHRHAAPLAVSGSAILLVFGPPFAVGGASQHHRFLRLGVAQALWASVWFFIFPVYFPGERQQAFATGLALTGLGHDLGDLPGLMAAQLPEEPAMSSPEVAEATPLVAPELPPATPLEENQLALPYEGEGRRMSVPVVFGHQGEELEVYMMFDTGATYTTMSTDTLRQLGVHLSDADPVITLHTANGERDAHIVLLDSIWLGNLRLEGVAIATCDNCASDDTEGLLGLNVSGAFNLHIDADRKEVVFTPRERFDRRLDVKPFTDLNATFTRFPGGRVEVEVRLANLAHRPISAAAATISCGGSSWRVDLPEISPDEEVQIRERLPKHRICETYEVALLEAYW